MKKSLYKFLELEASGGIIMIISSLCAIIICNTGGYEWYKQLLSAPVGAMVGGWQYTMPASEWVKEFLMAIFFLMVSLEIKNEILEGSLSNPKDIILPIATAVAGMAAPALIYVIINHGIADNLAGWAIPSATDIAFALCVMSFVRNVPAGLKMFLLALAIIDDLGAIIIIALFYSKSITLIYLVYASFVCAFFAALNRLRVESLWLYFSGMLVLWVFMHSSGLSPTIAGVITAAFVPMRSKEGRASTLKVMMHKIHPLVSFVILPVFAFSASGIYLGNVDASKLLSPVALGVGLGLFIGKQIGVFGAAYILIKLRMAAMPRGSNWLQLYAVCIITGVGFTMSLFISMMAFDSELLFEESKLGILAGSLLSAVSGVILLRLSTMKVDSKNA